MDQSRGGYALPSKRRPPWLAAETAFTVLGSADTAAGRLGLVARLDQRAREEERAKCGVPPLPAEADARSSHLRRGWCWGSQAFLEKLEALVEGGGQPQRSRGYRGAAARRSHDLALAQRWLVAGLEHAGLTVAELAKLPGSNWRKVALARLIAQGTTASHQWLDERLHMRGAANVSQILRLKRAEDENQHLPARLRSWLAAARKTQSF